MREREREREADSTVSREPDTGLIPGPRDHDLSGMTGRHLTD